MTTLDATPRPQLCWFSRQVRVFLALNPRPYECATFWIAAASSVMFTTNPMILDVAKSFEVIGGWPYDVAPTLAMIFGGLAGSQLFVLVTDTPHRLFRRFVAAGHIVWSVTMASLVLMGPPAIAPTDILYSFYAFASVSAYFQLKFGSRPFVPATDG